MTTAERHGGRSRLRTLVAPLILALACLLVYNANLRQIGALDTLPARYLPLLLWNGGTLELGDHARLFAHGHPMAYPRFRPANDQGRAAYLEPSAYWLIRTNSNQLASFYPVVAPLLVAPLYLPAALWLDDRGWVQPHLDRVAELMEKLAASLVAALASVFVFIMLRREGNRWCLPLAFAFAFGTNTWMISSQALWQHGTGELLIAMGMLLVLAPASAARTALLGAVCVLVAANRPPDALIAAAFGFFAMWRDWRDARWLLAGAAIPMAALLYYNLGFIGHIAGGYAMVTLPAEFLQSDWSGLAGLLVSPTRGLLVFSPFLAYAAVGLVQRLKSSETRALAVILTLAVIAQLLLYARVDWRAGSSWGPRWLTDILPILVWMLAPTPLLLRPFARGIFVVAIALSVGVQAVGAFWYTGISDELISSSGAASMDGAWDPKNVPFVTELRHPAVAGELLCDANGRIDQIGTTRLRSAEKLPELEPGAVLAGWALACSRTPAQVVLLVDGVILGTTTTFLSRADVDAALGTSAPSGWRIKANLWGVPPGEQVLQLAVRIDPRSDFRIIREQRVVVRPQLPVASAPGPRKSSTSLGAPGLDDPGFAAMAARATSLLQERQTDDGAWLTAHTTGLSYEEPELELNTFLTSTLVDMLSPLAQGRRPDAALERARVHLAAQIEGDGLVRYHGLPDAPGIGSLGCAITPDADDTALVWRIAGPDRHDARLQPMLEVLESYRDARGLYRTWLAPQRQYRCIDPGTNPNPTDVAIQLNVYMMLRQFAPSAAQVLCDNLQRALGDEDIWVYYARAPLLPYLRMAELGQLGCQLPLPVERLALSSGQQAIWSEAAHWLVEASGSPPDAKARQSMRNVLEQLAADDFALVRREPPLLYHNDLSATVERFYWSEDVAYALWLRLYELAGIAADPKPQPAP